MADRAPETVTLPLSDLLKMNFSGKVAIVTGGTQGIGKAISMALLEIGMKAVFEMTRSTYGRIDVIINNAGMLNESQWKKMIEVNFIGVVHGIQLALEYMGINNGGSRGFVINIASNKGLEGFDMAPIYSGTKHAIVGLTRSFGTQYHFDKTGVSVNAVCPGRTDTVLFNTFPSGSVDEENSMKHKSKSKPMSPDEVAKAVLQLLQDGKNGALLIVDGVKGIRYEN